MIPSFSDQQLDAFHHVLINKNFCPFDKMIASKKLAIGKELIRGLRMAIYIQNGLSIEPDQTLLESCSKT